MRNRICPAILSLMALVELSAPVLGEIDVAHVSAGLQNPVAGDTRQLHPTAMILPAGSDASTAPPTFVQTPVSITRFLNGTAHFKAVAVGAEPLEFQWTHGAEILPGATRPELELTDLQWSDAGNYTVKVSNRYGSSEATATLTLIAPTKLAEVAVGLGPIGYWRLDEADRTIVYDYWGCRDGKASAAVSTGLPGPAPNAAKGFEDNNTAFGFDGTNSVVEIPPLNISRTAMTILAWIKPNGPQDDYDPIVFCHGGNTAAGLTFQRGGQLGYWWNNAASTFNWASGLYPANDIWNFVALVVEPRKATIYLDDLSGFGLHSAVNVAHHPPEEFDAFLELGADVNTGRFFKGAIDDVVIYDRALTDTEIRSIRDAGVKGTLAHTQVAIVEQPKSQTIMAGSSHALRPKLIGSQPLSFQWKKDGQPIPSATRSCLLFDRATEADTSTYQLFVTQGATTIATDPVNLIVQPVSSCLNLAKDLVLHLKFDGDYRDSSGHSNHGSPRGNPEIVPGKIGSGALRCSTMVQNSMVTAANYVSLGIPRDLDFGPAQNFTVAFWVKFTGNPGDLPFIANNSFSTGDIGVTIAPSYQHASWSWGFNNALAPQPWPGIAICGPTSSDLNDGNWHHIVHVFDRTGDAITWLDGVRTNATPIAAAADWDFRTRMEWTIGQAGGHYAQQGTFVIDDLGIWRRPLTDLECQSIYIYGEKLGASFENVIPPKITIQVRAAHGAVVIEWPFGILESAASPEGPWSTVSGAFPSILQLAPSEHAKFYRVRL